MTKEPVRFLQTVPAPALRAAVSRAARCQDVAELVYRLAQRRGFALLHGPETWLATLEALNARSAGAPSWPPTGVPPSRA